MWQRFSTANSNAAAGSRCNILELFFMLVGVQAAWERLSEAVTIIGNISYYRKCYKGIPKLFRITFWTATGILTAGGCAFAFL